MIVVKFKRHLRYRVHVHFEPIRPESMYAALNYLTNNNKFYEDISVSYGLSSNEILNVADASLDAATTTQIHRLKAN